MLLSTLSHYYQENPSIILVLQPRITDILQILDDLPQRTTKHTWIMMMEIMLGACEEGRKMEPFPRLYHDDENIQTFCAALKTPKLLI